MKKLLGKTLAGVLGIAAACSLGALFAGCSDEKGTHGDGPEVPGQKLYNDVASLTPLRGWTPNAAESSDIKALNDFADRLNGKAVEDCAELWGDEARGNYCISPLSVAVYLGALAQGVDGQAREDISRMLGVDAEGMASLNNSLLRYLTHEGNDGSEVAIANSVWHTADVAVLDSYKERMAALFGAPVNELDLYSDSSVDVLNAWCGDKTHGVLDKIFQLPPRADVLIANALYLSANWISPFSEGETTREKFRGTEGESEVDMMHKSLMNYGYASAGGCAGVLLSMQGGFEFVVVLPDEGTDVAAVGKSLGAVVERLDASMASKRVNLSLPKFSGHSDAQIKELLATLGYPVYDLPAAGMTGNDAFAIRYSQTEIKHTTALKVTESGVELAAVTAGNYGFGTPEPLEEVEMKVDRPFYYLVRESHTGIILMTGRVMNM